MGDGSREGGLACRHTQYYLMDIAAFRIWPFFAELRVNIREALKEKETFPEWFFVRNHSVSEGTCLGIYPHSLHVHDEHRLAKSSFRSCPPSPWLFPTKEVHWCFSPNIALHSRSVPWHLLLFRVLESFIKGAGTEFWGTRTKHQPFSSQNFSDTSRISQQNPGISRPNVWFPCVSRDIPNFLTPPPVHVEDPHPTGKCPDQKVWVWVPVSFPEIFCFWFMLFSFFRCFRWFFFPSFCFPPPFPTGRRQVHSIYWRTGSPTWTRSHRPLSKLPELCQQLSAERSMQLRQAGLVHRKQCWWQVSVGARQRSDEGVVRRNGCPKGCFWRVRSFSAPLRFSGPFRCFKRKP